MHILFINYNFPGQGGVETATATLANAFQSSGEIVSIIKFRNTENGDNSKIDPSVKVDQFPDNQKLDSQINLVFLQNYICEGEVDLIINQEIYSDMYLLLQRVNNRPKRGIITVEHNAPDAKIEILKNYLKNEKRGNSFKGYIKPMFHPYLLYRATQHEKKRHKILYEISSKYVLLSNKYVGKFEYLVSDVNLTKLCFIPNPTNFDLLKAEGGISKKKKTIIFVGRLDNPQKGIDRLLKIWEAVFFEHPSWELLVIGDGPDRKMLEEYVSAKGIQRVNFLGHQSSVLTFYRNASIICLTSTVEGFPMVLIEAMAHGVVPVVYESFKAASDIIENNISGFTIEAFNEDYYISKLKLLMSNAEMLHQMSANAKSHSDRFNISRTLERWGQMLGQSI